MSDPIEFKPSDVGSIISESLKNDNDFIVNISGKEGTGKSTLGKQINKPANIKSHGSYNLEAQTLFYPTTDEISEAYTTERKYWCYQWDEAIRILYKLDWATIKSKALVKDFAVNRAMNIGTILCIPRMRDLNEVFRNWRINLWGEVIEKGVCVWFAPDWNVFAPDPWHWKDNFDIVETAQRAEKGRLLSKFDVSDKIKILSRCKGFGGITYFEKETGEEWGRYLQLKESKRTSLTTEVSKRDLRVETASYLLKSGKLTIQEIANALSISTQRIYQIKDQLNLQLPHPTQEKPLIYKGGTEKIPEKTGDFT